MNKDYTETIKIFVSDNQQVLPPVAGGRIRIAGIWGSAPNGFKVTYVGTFDIEHKQSTFNKMGNNAVEMLVPCSTEHFALVNQLNASFPDITLFDMAFHRYAHLSKEYIAKSREHLSYADVVVFTHPWSYSVLGQYVNNKTQLLVYDSQNVESFLRADILLKYKYGQLGTQLLREITQIEYDLCRQADLILSCSQRDRNHFIQLYNVCTDKVISVPNGVFDLPTPTKLTSLQKKKIRNKWRLEKEFTVVFSGSLYKPNIEALEFINQMAVDFKTVNFIITGDMHDVLSPWSVADNVYMLGLLSEKELAQAYQISDVALNPMKSGSGSNIKVFTYMQAGVPVLTTPLGARGLDVLLDGFIDEDEIVTICCLDKFSLILSDLLSNPSRRQKISADAQNIVMKYYNWKEISRSVCETIKLKSLL